MELTFPKLGFVLLLFCIGNEALTPSKLDVAGVPLQESSDLVVDLPGQPNVSFAQFAGYITVNESHGRAFFYWFFEAVSNPSSKPLVLWLNGGPGCSSVGYGAAEELGPLRVNKDGASVFLNEKSWNNKVNLLFLESPAGVGFSYSNTTSDYSECGDSQTALDNYAFLVGWFERFPMYLSHDFYIAGESYGGHYVPQLAKLITDMNNAAGKVVFPLKGILIGNAALDNALDSKGILDFAWSRSIVSDAFYQNVSNSCNFSAGNYSKECINLFNSIFEKYKPINIYSIYSNVCLATRNSSGSVFTGQEFFSSRKVVLPMANLNAAFDTIFPNRLAGATDPCIDRYVMEYLNRPDVQRALHANTTNVPYRWSPCSTVLTNWSDSPSSMLPTLKALIASGLRVWVYNGDTDGRIPVQSTRYSVGALKLPTEKDWYPWFHDEQVGGWSQVYQGLTYATVRGAGHMVPSFQPGRALALLTSFLAGTPLPSSSKS